MSKNDDIVSVRLPENLRKSIETLARETGWPKSYFMRLAVERYVKDVEDFLLSSYLEERALAEGEAKH
jgi:predicted DNA-binding protein